MQSVNYIALLVASIVGYIIPMIWYASFLFGNAWKRLSGIKEMKPSPLVMLVGFISTIVFNFIMLMLIQTANISTFFEGAVMGGMLWLGFIATTQLGSVLYDKKPVALYLINTLQYLVSMAVVGGILAIWK